MKHHLLKSVILSLILVMGVSNAWAKRYYFEVPEHWGHTESKVYKLRLYTGENNPNGWSRALQKLEGTTNTYYYDNSGYTHVQFCQMKDGKESEIYISNTKYNTTRTAFPQTDDDETLLKVSNTIAEENPKDQYTQYEVADWDYPIFTAQDVHFLFHNLKSLPSPKLLIGTKESYTIYDLTKVKNSISLHHCYINKLQFIGYTIIQSDEPTGNFEGSFLDKSAQYTQNDTRTKIHYEPLVGNVFHRTNHNNDEEKLYINDINDLNTTLTIRCEVSYDDGATYESTGTLPVNITTTTNYFDEDWDVMDQTGTITLTKGSNIFQASATSGFEKMVFMEASDYNTDLYEFVGWKKGDALNTYNPRPYKRSSLDEETDFVVRLKRINNNLCTVTFKHPDGTNETTQQVAPNTRATKPTVEASNPGQICKWYSDGSQQNEFDFDTHIIEDITLYGAWVPEAEEGDYRLLYVEQVVEKSIADGDEWKTIITRKKAHPSDIIKKRTESGVDTVSLHVYNKNNYQAVKNPKATNNEDKYYDSPSNSEVILQRYNGTIWEDKEHHMVFGPMETLPAMAMLPGRRNAESNATLKYDDGIPAIQTDEKYNGNGVWNFPIAQTVNGEEVTATLERDGVKRYSGKYYIRTANADGGWNNYTIHANYMTFSKYQASLGLGNEEFTHYFCKWVDLDKLDSKYVHYVVANDFAQAVSDTLIADRTDLFGNPLEANQQIVGNDAVLPTSANIRFSWREENNALHRAYISGSTVVRDRFLVLEANNSQVGIFDPTSGNNLAISGLEDNEQIFTYDSKWIYHADVQMQPRADIQVTAKYNEITQYFIGDQDKFRNTVLQGSGEQKYLVRLLYDFKNNEIISAYVPGASPDVHNISTNLMLIRQNNNEATQLIFNNETRRDMEPIPTNRRAYGVIEFTEKRLIQGKDDEDKSLNDYEKSLYWISFPFNVDVSKAISFGEYGKHWIIQEYNGERRAEEGMWLDSETFWDYKWDQNITLEAGKGYVLALDVDQIASDGLFGLSGNRPIGIYFPSTEYISTAITEQAEVSTIVPAHVCTIKRETPKGDRRIADSHWNVIGVPSYRNTTGTYQFANIETKPTEVKYYYRWLGDFNKYQAEETTSPQDFQSTFAYMVQFAGQINWTNIFNVSGDAPQALAARQSTDAEQEHRLRLELHQKGNKADHTFVRLQDEDGVTNRFDFNYDLCKVINAGANIYSVITAEESPVEVAANVMPIAETIIPVGVKITAAGEYTFAMPEGTDGIVVELIDYENNTRTNMLLDNYTVNLGKGTFENRFALHVKPSKVTTSLEDVNTNTIGVKKYLIDGVLYMQKDGVLYDAQGKLVR